MKTVKEIDKQIQKEHDYIVQLYAQINSYEQSVEHLKAERQDAEKKENEMFIFFDKNANFVKTVTTGYGEDFRYVSPVEDEDTMEYWLRKNKLYAHRASSFCDRNRNWYDLSFKDQLENLCWEFDKNGKLKKTQW